MKNPLILSALILTSLLACQQKPAPTQTTYTEEPRKPLNKKKVSGYLYASERLHAFSDSSKQDTFRLSVSGKDFLKAKVRFEIISHTGEVVYSDNFDSNFLIDYGIMEGVTDPASITDEMRSAYIQNRLKTFFDDKNFKSPAIKADAAWEDYYPDKELFEELKAKPDAISFYYLLGKEDGRYIAYSDKKDKAVLFYNCC